MKKKYMNLPMTLFSPRMFLLWIICFFNLSTYAVPGGTTLSAGDIIFTGYNVIPGTTENADVISFVLLKDISAGTHINFTDRGYFGGSSWQNIASSEGTIRWVAGTALPMGTQVVITGLTSKEYDPATDTSTLNGTVEKTEHYGSGANTASTGLLLSAPGGDQIIAFQGGSGSPTDAGVIFLAGLHFNKCTANTTDANWDAADCTNSPSKSVIPPGLVNGISAFRAIPPTGNSAYSGRFNTCAGGPYTTVAQIRTAVMDRANWLFDNNGAGLSIPSACDLSIPNSTPVSIYEKLFWHNYDIATIESIDLDGQNRTPVLSNGQTDEVYSIAVDPIDEKLYWNHLDNEEIYRSNLDGSSIETIVTSTGDVNCIILDPIHGKIYWNSYTAGQIERANLNGTNREIVVSGEKPVSLALDISGGKIYWFDETSSAIRRSSLNGQDIEEFATAVGYPWSLYFDHETRFVYWDNYGDDNGKIERKHADSGSRQTIVDNCWPVSVSIDKKQGKIYWLNQDENNVVVIMRANLNDGTGREVFANTPGFPYALIIPYDYSTIPQTNSAPTLSGGPYILPGFPGIPDSPTALVSGMLSGPAVTYSDSDAGALSGIAITAASGNGTWEYSTDGATWFGVGTISNSAALLLSSEAQLHYIAGTGAETATLTFRGWDQTSGTATINGTRSTADASTNGGTTAFSAGTAQAEFSVIIPIEPDGNGVVYVKKGGSGNGSGDGWGNAVGELADALKAAKTDTDIKEIWVAGGTYKPAYRIDNLSDADPLDRWNTFLMVNNVKVYGGFAGDEDAIEDRDLDNPTYETILSGDLGGDDSNDMDVNRSDNAYKVMVFAGNTGSALLDGFTVKGGKASSVTGLNGINGQHIDAHGAGIYIKGASPTLSNILVTGNDARTVSGGGIWLHTSAAVLDQVKVDGNQGGFGAGLYTNGFSGSISHSEIRNNTGDSGGGMYNVAFTGTVNNTIIDGNTAGISGGVSNNYASTATFTDVTLSSNKASGSYGGGMSNDASPVVLNNVIISDNWANRGAGIFNLNSAITVTNSVIQNNTTNPGNANNNGGGIYNMGASSNGTFKNILISDNTAQGSGGGVWIEDSAPRFINTTISGNTSKRYQSVGGLYNNGTSAGAIVQNSIIWGNHYINGSNRIDNNLKHNGSAMPTVSYSLIGNNEGETGSAWKASFGTDGGNNSIGIDPEFTDAGNGDYSLAVSSPAVNKGSNSLFTGLDANTKDLAGNDRIYKYSDGGVIDMGAYELQAIGGTAPQFTSTPTLTIPYGQLYNYSITATGDELLPTTLSAEVLPDWLTFSLGGQSQAVAFGNIPAGKGIGGVAGDDAGNIYAITSNGTEIYKIATDGTTSLWKSGLQGGSVFSLHVADGYIYIPRYYSSTSSITRIPLSDPSAAEVGFANNPYGAMSLADHGDWIYAADLGGTKIFRVHKVTNAKEDILTGLPFSPFGLTFGTDDKLYIATWVSRSIVRHDGGSSFTPVVSGLPYNVTSIRQDDQGNFYVSMEYGGVRKYSADFSTYTTVSQTANDNVWGLSLTSGVGLVYAKFSTNQVYRLQTGATLS
ncbi:hypothetical protein G5B30_16995, partial [Sphingobacterium sp. SGG-5]|uniref:hypothetical protein n=1 Tax=Sphingobacterium sp. SGG-5 TaxID=2710881 RepID=UPI0013F0B07D